MILAFMCTSVTERPLWNGFQHGSVEAVQAMLNAMIINDICPGAVYRRVPPSHVMRQMISHWNPTLVSLYIAFFGHLSMSFDLKQLVCYFYHGPRYKCKAMAKICKELMVTKESISDYYKSKAGMLRLVDQIKELGCPYPLQSLKEFIMFFKLKVPSGLIDAIDDVSSFLCIALLCFFSFRLPFLFLFYTRPTCELQLSFV